MNIHLFETKEGVWQIHFWELRNWDFTFNVIITKDYFQINTPMLTIYFDTWDSFWKYNL